MRTLRTLLCLSAACTAVVATAQLQDETEEEAPPRYNVEIIIFAHNDVDPGEERFELASAAFERPTGAFPDELPPAEAIVAIEPLAATESGENSDAAAPDGTAGQTGLLAAATADTDAGNADDLPDVDDPLEFMNPFGDATAPGVGSGLPAVRPIRLLTADELSLGDARGVIDRLGAYRLLGHGGWQQDGLEQTEAIRFDVGNLGITNPRGTVQLYLGRFLHFGIDLEYRLPPGLRLLAAPERTGEPSAIAESVSPFSSIQASSIQGSAPRSASPLQEIEIADRLRFETERNAIRSGELHYIDHPLFGVLVLITPAPEPEEEDAGSETLDQPAA